jgi:NitT/TauT family transport system ATP-binding protein
MLSLAAGLDKPTAGNIAVSGRVAMMFQEPALFPWLTAGGNVELALRARGVGRAERRQRTGELLDIVQLGGFGSKRPHELSGGMRQRVALARASRPGRVLEEFAVAIPRPRRIDSAPVAGLASQITDRLREEMSRHGD